MDNKNPFDEIGFTDLDEVERINADREAKGDRLDNLIHRAFSENEAGVELLELWAESLLMIPTAQAGMDLLEVGINEGVKQFIRNIIITVRKIDEGNDNE